MQEEVETADGLECGNGGGPVLLKMAVVSFKKGGKRREKSGASIEFEMEERATSPSPFTHSS